MVAWKQRRCVIVSMVAGVQVAFVVAAAEVEGEGRLLGNYHSDATTC